MKKIKARDELNPWGSSSIGVLSSEWKPQSQNKKKQKNKRVTIMNEI